MKHLKLYESVDDTEYYKIISIYQFKKYCVGLLEMSEKNINIIESFSDKIQVYVNYIKAKESESNVDSSYCSLYAVGNRSYIGQIVELTDEWFVVIISKTYYLCDQIEGLKKCLDDKILKKLR